MTAVEDKILQPGEAAKLLGIDPKTLTRWARLGKIEYFKTLGGHRRYCESVVLAIREPSGN